MDDFAGEDVDHIFNTLANRKINFDEPDPSKEQSKVNLRVPKQVNEDLPTTRPGSPTPNKITGSTPRFVFENTTQEEEPLPVTYKLYQFWTGNNSFCCEGRLLNGLNRRSNHRTGTILLVLLSFLVYTLFPAFYLYERISPYLTLITIYMFILTVFFYVMTTTYSGA